APRGAVRATHRSMNPANKSDLLSGYSSFMNCCDSRRRARARSSVGNVRGTPPPAGLLPIPSMQDPMATPLATLGAPVKGLLTAPNRAQQRRRRSAAQCCGTRRMATPKATRAGGRGDVAWTDGTQAAQKRDRIDLPELTRPVGRGDRGRVDRARNAP